MIATDVSFQREGPHSRHTLTCVSVPLSKGTLKAFLELLPLAILCHLTLTDTSANECVTAHCHSISTSTDTVCLSALFFAGSHRPRTASGNGKCRISTLGVREWWCIACVGTNGVPSAHPAFCFRPGCPSLARLPARWKICFRFPFHVPRRASLTSELFQLYVKNKHPARSCVQNSPGHQNKFIPPSIYFLGNSKPKMTFQFPFAKMR